MANRLATEPSPYLRQHADNPVDWYPWGAEALARARAEDKPIFLSIGYAACHWCHVMAHESFEDPRVAALLNEHFVSIKVDREERPDLDDLYMRAVQALTGSGGWPMSVFLTPEGAPFYGGTYFPPTARYGLRSFSEILRAVNNAWRERRGDVDGAAAQLVAHVRANLDDHLPAPPEALSRRTLEAAARALVASHDAEHGGWGTGPKFPQAMAVDFLLRYGALADDAAARSTAVTALHAMARGGIYDQLDGGFHRYATDDAWLVPHFEKMLYDNALLARACLHAWQATGDELLRAVTVETLDYVLRELADPAGVQKLHPQHLPSSSSKAGTAGLYSTQDADSAGHEGAYYIWTQEELRALLGADAPSFERAYGVSADGNFEGHNILSLVGDLAEREALADARRTLLEARRLRVPPARDEKVLASWNGLMLTTLAEASWALERPDYLAAAQRLGSFLLREMVHGERLWHAWQAGAARLNGYLEDYAAVAQGLLALHQATFEPHWLAAARRLAETMLAHFGAESGFYDTSDDHERLIGRPRQLQDNATPSGNALAVTVLLQLATLTGEERYHTCAWEALQAMGAAIEQYPLGFGQWLTAASDALFPRRQVVIVGAPDAADTQALLDVCRRGFRPQQIVVVAPSASAAGDAAGLLEGRVARDGRATAYVCSSSTCAAPVTTPSALAALLAS